MNPLQTIKNTYATARQQDITPNNSADYKSLKRFGKEYAAEEKGSIIKGLLYALPLMAAGGIGGYYAGNSLHPLARKMPSSIKNSLRKIMDKTDLGKRIGPDIMDTPIMARILKSNPDLDKQEFYEYIKDTVSAPSTRTAIAGIAIGADMGGRIGSYSGSKRGLHAAENESGMSPSTNPQFIGRFISGTVGDYAGALAGAAAGVGTNSLAQKYIGKRLPNNPSGRLLRAVIGTGAIAIPTILGGSLGEAAAEYGTSRYLQKHTNENL